MLVSELLTKVRRRIRDVDKLEYTDNELISYLNDAIMLVGQLLINTKNDEMLTDLTLTNTSTLKPVDFFKFAASYPVQVQKNDLICYGNLPQVTRYFKKAALVENISDKLPFTYNGYNQILEQITAMLALNRNEFDISQDKVLVDEVMKLISSV